MTAEGRAIFARNMYRWLGVFLALLAIWLFTDFGARRTTVTFADPPSTSVVAP